MSAPLLVLLTVVLAVPVRVTDFASVIWLPVTIVMAGFAGTQRVWLCRLHEGDALGSREIWPLTRSFIGRFVLLGAEIFIALIVPITVLSILLYRAGAPFGILIAANIMVGLVTDVLLTFVVPALALTTRSVHQAWRLGLAMIRHTWPTSAWYICAPGLSLVVAARLLQGGQLNSLLTFVVTAATAVVALWFKGAIVAFYVRQPATED